MLPAARRPKYSIFFCFLYSNTNCVFEIGKRDDVSVLGIHLWRPALPNPSTMEENWTAARNCANANQMFSTVLPQKHQSQEITWRAEVTHAFFIPSLFSFISCSPPNGGICVIWQEKEKKNDLLSIKKMKKEKTVVQSCSVLPSLLCWWPAFSESFKDWANLIISIVILQDHLFLHCYLARCVWSVLSCAFACGITNGMGTGWRGLIRGPKNLWQ